MLKHAHWRCLDRMSRTQPGSMPGEVARSSLGAPPLPCCRAQVLQRVAHVRLITAVLAVHHLKRRCPSVGGSRSLCLEAGDQAQQLRVKIHMCLGGRGWEPTQLSRKQKVSMPAFRADAARLRQLKKRLRGQCEVMLARQSYRYSLGISVGIPSASRM